MIRNFWIVESNWPKEFINHFKNCNYELRRDYENTNSSVGIPTVIVARDCRCTRLRHREDRRRLGPFRAEIGGCLPCRLPRTDLHVSVDGVEVKPGLALGSWAAFAGTDSDASVMGDLVLLEDEVNPVMRKLRAAGFEITAVTTTS